MRKKLCLLLLVLLMLLPGGVFAGTQATNGGKTPVPSTKSTVKVPTTQTKLTKEKAAKEKAAKEKAAKDKAAKEKAAKEKAAKEKAAKEKAAKEKAAKEKADREKEAIEKAAQERAARERAEAAKNATPVAVKHEFKASDGLTVTADFYAPKDAKTTDTLIIAFHRSEWSRGEYASISPVLSRQQYAMFAVDQRSGDNIKGVTNETAERAGQLKLSREWADAQKDVEAAIEYATNTLGYKKIVLWGSSYSTSLALGSAAKYKDLVTGVILFSPAEYLSVNGASSSTNAAQIKVPTFIAASPFEAGEAEGIYIALKDNHADSKLVIVSEDNLHGSSMLWSGDDLPYSKDLWSQLLTFLSALKITSN